MSDEIRPFSVECLNAFLSVPDQRFVCSLGSQFPNERRTFKVGNWLRPASKASSRLQDIPAAAQLVEFYRHHDGGLLFQDLESESVGLELLSQSAWPLLTAAILDVYQSLDPKERPEWLDSFVAFGEVPHSGNYFVVPLAGPNAGKVIYCDHEGPTDVLAPDFDAFVAQIVDDPAGLLYELGCFLRFEREGQQWIPERFFSGAELAW